MRKVMSLMGVFVTAGALVAVGGTTALAAEYDPVEGVVDQALVQVGQEVASDEVPLAGSQELAGAGVTPTLLGPVSVTPHDIDNSAVRLREDGVQVLTVLEEGTTSATFSVAVPEGAVLRDEGDQVSLALEAEGVRLTFAEFDKPWAVDANGVSLPTEYLVSGDTIVQTVDTTGAAFPVVADPKITPRTSGANGAGLYLSMSGTELKAAASGIVAVGGAAAFVTCKGFTKLPAIVAKIAQLACSVTGVPTVKLILNSIVSIQRSTTIVNGGCYEAKVLPQGPFRKVAASRC